MSEMNGSNRTMKEIISDATDKELECYDTGSITPDQLKRMAAKAEREKKRYRRQIAAIAALLVLVAVGGAMVFSTYTADVEADKNSKEEIVTEDGIVIEDGGWGSSSKENWVITEWTEVKVAKAAVDKLLVPRYIPLQYDFQELSIEYLDGENSLCTYIFKKESEEIKINQFIQSSGLNYFEVNGEQEIISCEKGEIYIDNSQESKKATILIDGSIVIDIWCNLSDSDIVKVINGLEY